MFNVYNIIKRKKSFVYNIFYTVYKKPFMVIVYNIFYTLYSILNCNYFFYWQININMIYIGGGSCHVPTGIFFVPRDKKRP